MRATLGHQIRLEALLRPLTKWQAHFRIAAKPLPSTHLLISNVFHAHGGLPHLHDIRAIIALCANIDAAADVQRRGRAELGNRMGDEANRARRACRSGLSELDEPRAADAARKFGDGVSETTCPRGRAQGCSSVCRTAGIV